MGALDSHLFNLPNSTTGTDQILIDTLVLVPAFTPFLLAFVFFTVFLGGIVRQKARTGDADYSTWAVVASMSMLIISLILSTVVGIIQLDWLVIVVVINIFSGVWMFLEKKDGNGV